MTICTCKKCRYTFQYPLLPAHCPDCGAGSVQKATAQEIREFTRMQKIIREEIRLGIYSAGLEPVLG